MLTLTGKSGFTDEELLKAMQADGAEWAFRKLFDKYYTPLVTFAARILAGFVGSGEAYNMAADAVQNVFVSLYENSQIEVSSSVRALLYTSVRNACYNVIKHQKIVRQYEATAAAELTDEAPQTDSAESLIEQSEANAKIAQALATLPEQCRKIFIMSRFEGASNQQIADLLDISKRTVETQISNALKALRKLLFQIAVLIISIVS